MMAHCDVPDCESQREVNINQVRLCVAHYRQLLPVLAARGIELRSFGGDPLTILAENSRSGDEEPPLAEDHVTRTCVPDVSGPSWGVPTCGRPFMAWTVEE